MGYIAKDPQDKGSKRAPHPGRLFYFSYLTTFRMGNVVGTEELEKTRMTIPQRVVPYRKISWNFP
jgi:hypothetical protein